MTKFLRYSTLTLIFLTTLIPLYVDNGLFFPFITGKAFAFRIIVEIAFALWLLLVLRDRQYAPKFSWLSVIITAFAVVTLIADLAGINPLRSIWSNFERMEGWVTVIHLWAYFMIMTSVFGSGEEGRRMWHNFFRMTLAAAAIVGIYGVVQLAGGAAIHQGSTRIDASLGNAAYMAVYMLGHAFLAFYLGLVEWSRNRKGIAWIYYILGIFFSFLVFETETRGTILGLVGGIALALGIYAVFGKNQAKSVRAWSATVIIVLVLLGVGLVAGKNTSFVKSHEVLNRLASISLTSDGQARQYIWPMAIKGAFQNPKTAIIGSGQENFNYIFNANYNPKMWNQEQWFDRAHNVYLDWLIAGGLAALLLYISLFIVSLVLLWRSSLTFTEKCLMTGLFVGYGIHNVFVFDNIASYLLFFTMLGFVHSVTAEKPIRWLEVSDAPTENMAVVRDYIYMPVIIILALASLYFVNIKPIEANKKLIVAMTACSGSNAQPSADLFAAALKYNQPTANQEIREQLLTCAAQVIPANVSTDLKKAFYDLSIQEIHNQSLATPLDARGYALGGVFLNDLGDWKNALALLLKANELSPNKQSLMLVLAQNYLNTNKVQEGLDILKKAYDSAPENDNAKMAYATSLVLVGQEKKAIDLFNGDASFLDDPRLIPVYAQNHNYPKLIELYKKLIEQNPKNIQYYGSLAETYYESGQTSLALSTLQDMEVKFPEAKKDVDNAIKQVKDNPKK